MRLKFRYYEERELRWQQDKTKKMLEFDNHIQSLQGQLEFERSNDKRCKERKKEFNVLQRVSYVFWVTSQIKLLYVFVVFAAVVKKLEDSVAKDEAELEALLKEEKKEQKEYTKEQSQLEDIKMARQNKKAEMEDKDAELNELKKRQQNVQREVAAFQKQFNNLETKIEQKKSDRHLLLQACKATIIILNSALHYVV